jgi:hypothetical protein
MNEISLLIPIYKRNLNYYESVSVHRTVKLFRNRADIILFGPESINIGDINCEIKVDFSEISKFVGFKSEFFKSKKTYNSLLLNLDFYEKFRKYEYLLIAQADSFIFGGDLKRWCREGFDYVGAPWWKDSQNPNLGLWHVGNGGFSLRKVESAIRVLESFDKLDLPFQVFDACIESLDTFRMAIRLLFLTKYMQKTGRCPRENKFNEDYYWGIMASKIFPWYKVPDPFPP